MNWKNLFATAIVLCAISFLCSCEDRRTMKTGDVTPDTTELFDKAFVSRLVRSSPVLTLNSLTNTSAFQKTYHGTKEINFDDDTETDTLIYFTHQTDTIIYAKANSGPFLWKMNLHTSNIVWDTNVAIGCIKSTLNAKLKSKALADFAVVWGEDAAETFYFSFHGDTLTNIRYEMHFEAVN